MVPCGDPGSFLADTFLAAVCRKPYNELYRKYSHDGWLSEI